MRSVNADRLHSHPRIYLGKHWKHTSVGIWAYFPIIQREGGNWEYGPIKFGAGPHLEEACWGFKRKEIWMVDCLCHVVLDGRLIEKLDPYVVENQRTRQGLVLKDALLDIYIFSPKLFPPSMTETYRVKSTKSIMPDIITRTQTKDVAWRAKLERMKIGKWIFLGRAAMPDRGRGWYRCRRLVVRTERDSEHNSDARELEHGSRDPFRSNAVMLHLCTEICHWFDAFNSWSSQGLTTL